MTINRRDLVVGAAATAVATAIPAGSKSAIPSRGGPPPKVSTRYPFFGISPESYATGETPAIAINELGQAVALHQGSGQLYVRLGQVEGTVLRWTGRDSKFDTGFNPSVALTKNDVVLEVHDSGGASPNCWYRTGRVVGETIDWTGGAHAKYDGGRDPAVAVSGTVVVEVHSSEVPGRLFWSVGRLENGTTLELYDKGQKFDTGFHPSIAINEKGLVVEVHDDGLGSLWYWTGQVVGKTIEWKGHAKYDSGINPSVVLTDDGYVFEVHQAQGIPPLVNGGTLWQRYGRVNDDDHEITWIDVFGNGQSSNYFDDGSVPCIASNGRQAVQAHSLEGSSDLYANACLVIDRANWMQVHRAALGRKTLGDIAMPATHDAGMYLGGFSLFGKTQDLDIYGQLSAGARYFDLRPQYTGDDTFVLHHGSGLRNVKGAALNDVLDQVARFMDDRKELVILKFSHYENFSEDRFDKMCDLIKAKIGTFLYTKPLAPGKRLATIPLDDYLGDHGTVLVVCDGLPKVAGIYLYRDWKDKHPEKGQLTVFDVYSETTKFEVMAYGAEPDKEQPTLPRGQLPKFKNFDGKCKKDANVPCDLFLLSWTLTPLTGVWEYARTADKNLVGYVDGMLTSEFEQHKSIEKGKNAFGRMINLIYVDYVEYARATDLALILNGVA
jgi:hypothetical protein